MDTKQLLTEAKNHETDLIGIRHFLHRNPEVGFDLNTTIDFVENELKKTGLVPTRCGKCGLTATIGKGSRVFMLRADMDALPVKEEAALDFASANGNMHACGHDLHTTMLLGAARLLKAHEKELCGIVKLDFQPSEESFEGARDMIHSGLLENPKVDAALMIHVSAAMPMPVGTALICNGGVSAPAADCFEITVQGKGCHGSMPEKGIDPVSISAHIITALQEIHARELNLSEEAVLTIGSIHGGFADNVIPDSVQMAGTIRTYDEETRKHVKNRLVQISEGISGTFGGKATVSFVRQCPTLQNDAKLSECVTRYTKELLGDTMAFHQSELPAAPDNKPSKSVGSEDFAYISQEVPSIMLAMAAGEPSKGYTYPQHHPKVMFDESVLSVGSAVYAYNAIRWLSEHS